MAGRPLVLHEALENRIETWTRQVAQRLRRPYKEFAAGVYKQASVPEGAVVAGLAGTAPALVLELERLRRGDAARARRASCASSGRSRSRPSRCDGCSSACSAPERRVLRLYGVSESAVAAALAAAGGDGDGVEATICARDFEIHVDLVVEPGAERARRRARRGALAAPLERVRLRARPDPIEAIVLALCRERGLTLATAESCTGGLVAARLTSVPGSSDVFVGGVVAYANERQGLGARRPGRRCCASTAPSPRRRPRRWRRARGPGSAPIVAVAVTGIAGPGGGTAEKPVGLVYLHAAGPGAERGARVQRARRPRDGAQRAPTVAALHLVRELVTEL